MSWHLGALGKKWDGRGTLYVHLVRDPDAVAASFAKRWDSTFRASMIRAFGHGIVMRSREWPVARRLNVARFYTDTVNTNIEEFLAHRPSLTVNLETIDTDFSLFLDRIGAEGELAAAIAEWKTMHNPSGSPPDEWACMECRVSRPMSPKPQVRRDTTRYR